MNQILPEMSRCVFSTKSRFLKLSFITKYEKLAELVDDLSHVFNAPFSFHNLIPKTLKCQPYIILNGHCIPRPP